MICNAQAQVDWAKLGNAKIPIWLQQIRSNIPTIRRNALEELKDSIAPWELLDGYGSTEELLSIAESQIPESIVPFLVQLLKDEGVKDKHFLLDILFDLSRYEFVNKDFVPLRKRDSYNDWAKRIRANIRSEISLYRTLMNSDSHEVKLIAKDLIDNLMDKRIT